jgi:WD40 repeat protein
MRRFLRQFRRPVVILVVLYLACVWLLSSVLPPQPTMIVPRSEFMQMLIGFSPDGRRLAVGPHAYYTTQATLSEDSFQVWQLDSAPPSRIDIRDRAKPGFRLAFLCSSPAGRRLFWRYLDEPEWWGSRKLPAIISPEVSPDGRWIVTEGIRDWVTGRSAGGLPEFFGQLFLLPGGSVTLKLTEFDGGAHFQVSRWDLDQEHEIRRMEWDNFRTAEYYVNWGCNPEISQDGRWLLQQGAVDGKWGKPNSLIVWDVATGRKHICMPHAESATFIDSRVLASTHTPTDESLARLCLTNLVTGTTYDCLPIPPQDEKDNDISIVLPAPDGQTLAAGILRLRSNWLARWPRLADWLSRCGLYAYPVENAVVVMAAADGRELAWLPHGPRMEADIGTAVAAPTLAFSADGQRLAVLGDDAIRIWDLPIRKRWTLILSLAAIPPAAICLLILAVRFIRRLRTPRPTLPGAV